MADSDLDLLQTALKRHWSWVPSKKAKGYVNAFFAAQRRGTTITAKVGFMPHFGDSRKRNIICSARPPRWRGHVLLSLDTRLCGHAIGLDSLAMASRVLSPASTWRRPPSRHEQPCLSPSRARPP